jgi:hypothetical protein
MTNPKHLSPALTGWLFAGLIATVAAAGCAADPSDRGSATINGGTTVSSASGSTGPAVAFASPHDGDAVTNPVKMQFTATEFTVEPAGAVHSGAGHFHVMIDTPCLAAGEAIPKDATHVHFGKGQTSAALDLPAGRHTLCLQAGDGVHTALALTDTISVDVDDSPSVSFVEPANGAVVTSPVHVVMKATNFALEPAGAVHGGAGHLHLMVDTPCITAGQTIPKNDTHLHFGNAQTETDLVLAPGAHHLCLQAGDGLHNALPITREVDVTVAK